MALQVQSKMLAGNAGVSAEEAAKEWAANVISGITIIPSGTWGVNRAQEPDWQQPRAPPVNLHTTFDKSGHHAPHISFKFIACLRGQSAVISSLQSNSLASIP
jgi:hypothetical protein